MVSPEVLVVLVNRILTFCFAILLCFYWVFNYFIFQWGDRFLRRLFLLPDLWFLCFWFLLTVRLTLSLFLLLFLNHSISLFVPRKVYPSRPSLLGHIVNVNMLSVVIGLGYFR